MDLATFLARDDEVQGRVPSHGGRVENCCSCMVAGDCFGMKRSSELIGSMHLHARILEFACLLSLRALTTLYHHFHLSSVTSD